MAATTRIILHPDPLTALDYCLAELAEFSQSQAVRRAFLLVPEEAKADTERRYMENFDRRGLMLAEVVSFRRLAYRLFSEAGGLAQKRIGENGKALLLTRILQAKQASYPYLGKLAGKASYAAELSQIMGDFSRYGLTPQDLDLVLVRGRLSASSRDKLQDLARLQRDFSQLKAQLGLTDGDEDLSRLSRLLKAKDHPRLAFLGQAKIWLAGFGLVRAFTPQELEVLAALNQQVAELTLALSPAGLGAKGQVIQPDQLAATSFAHQSLKSLRSVLPGAEIINLENPHGPCAVTQTAGLTGAENINLETAEVGAESRKSPAPCAGLPSRPARAVQERRIQLWRSPNSREELAAAAGEIKLLLSQGTYRKRDIAVALCRAEDLDRASAIFADFGLDPFMAEARPLEESPLFRYLDLFCQLASGRGKAEDLIALAQTGLVGLKADPDKFRLGLDHYENFLLASPARFLSDLNRDWLYARREGGKRARTFYQTYLAPQVKAAEALRSARTNRAKASFVLNWLDQDSGIRKRLEAWAQELHLQGESERALVLANSWESVISSLEELLELLGTESISQADFADLLLSSLRGKKPQGIPLGLDRIRLGGPQQILLYPAKVLFILGATAASFPGPAPDEGLLHNEEREEIEAASQRTLPNYRRDSVRAGRALAHYLSLRGSDALYLSCPSLDQDDLSDLQIELAGRTDLKLKQKIFVEASYPDQRWLSPSRARRYLALSQKKRQPWQEAWQQLLAPYLPELAPDPLDNLKPSIYLAADLTAELMAQIQTMSVSHLQTFNDCPYQYFAENVLKLQVRELYQPQPNLQGSFLHALMEKSLTDLIERLEPCRQDPELASQVLRAWQADLDQAYIRRHYQELCGEADFQSYADPFIREVQGRRLRRKALTVLRYEGEDLQKGSFLPLTLEWQFPGEQTAQPLSLKLAGRPIVLRGKIDRVDQGPQDSVRLIDYKSKDKSLQQDALLCGQQLQLPLYARAWETVQEQSQVTALALESLVMADRDVLRDQDLGKAKPLKPRSSLEDSTKAGQAYKLSRLSDYALAYSQALLDDMSRGNLSPQPLATGKAKLPCQIYCPYKAICRYEEQVAEARARRIWLSYEGDNKTKKGLAKYLQTYEESGLLAPQLAARERAE